MRPEGHWLGEENNVSGLVACEFAACALGFPFPSHPPTWIGSVLWSETATPARSSLAGADRLSAEGVGMNAIMRETGKSRPASGAGRNGSPPKAWTDFCATMRIPTQSGQGFRFDPGRHSEMKPAAIPR